MVWWSYRLHATSLAVDPRSTRFAVAASSDALNADLLFVFAAENPKPLRITRFAGGTRLREVVWLPDSQAQASALAFRTSDQFYSVVRDASAVELPRATNLPVANADASHASLFAQLIPEVAVAVEVETDERAALPLLPQNSELLPGITGMSSHTLPSVQDMFDTFFDRMVALRHPATEASEQQEEEAGEDVPVLYKEKNKTTAKTLPVQPADALQSGELEDEAEVDVAEEEEESFFDMDEMVAYIKQLKLSEPAADEALDTEAKAKKAKKKEKKEENEVKNAVETTTPVKSKGKREKATDDGAETVASEARKTPRRKESKEDTVMAEDDDASTASVRRSTRNVEKKEEEKKDEKKQDKKQVDDEEFTKTPRRRGRAATAEKKEVAESERDDEASTASLRRSTRHAPPEKKKEEDDETSNAGIARRSTRQRKAESDGEEDEASAAAAAAGEAKTPRRRGRSATEKEDESELSDAKASKQRSRSTRSQSTSEKNAGTKSPRKGQK